MEPSEKRDLLQMRLVLITCLLAAALVAL